jgi:hypothetical protein
LRAAGDGYHSHGDRLRETIELMCCSSVARSRQPMKSLAYLAALVVSLTGALARADDASVSVGMAATAVGPLGPFEGGGAIMVQGGWSPLPELRVTAAVEKAVFVPSKIMCDCAEVPCCQGANASYTWLGLGLEGHATPRSRVDLYAGAELGTVVRNAWRFAAKGQIGFDVRMKPVAVGLFGGVMFAASDSLFNANENRTFTAGLRVLVVLPVR